MVKIDNISSNFFQSFQYFWRKWQQNVTSAPMWGQMNSSKGCTEIFCLFYVCPTLWSSDLLCWPDFSGAPGNQRNSDHLFSIDILMIGFHLHLSGTGHMVYQWFTVHDCSVEIFVQIFRFCSASSFYLKFFAVIDTFWLGQ